MLRPIPTPFPMFCPTFITTRQLALHQFRVLIDVPWSEGFHSVFHFFHFSIFFHFFIFQTFFHFFNFQKFLFFSFVQFYRFLHFSFFNCDLKMIFRFLFKNAPTGTSPLPQIARTRTFCYSLAWKPSLQPTCVPKVVTISWQPVNSF